MYQFMRLISSILEINQMVDCILKVLTSMIVIWISKDTEFFEMEQFR